MYAIVKSYVVPTVLPRSQIAVDPDRVAVSLQKRFSDQRAKLLALEYHDPFTTESLALVERLFNDLVTTTESYEDLQQRVSISAGHQRSAFMFHMKFKIKSKTRPRSSRLRCFPSCSSPRPLPYISWYHGYRVFSLRPERQHFNASATCRRVLTKHRAPVGGESPPYFLNPLSAAP